jgi:hypothetical protein
VDRQPSKSYSPDPATTPFHTFPRGCASKPCCSLGTSAAPGQPCRTRRIAIPSGSHPLARSTLAVSPASNTRLSTTLFHRPSQAGGPAWARPVPIGGPPRRGYWTASVHRLLCLSSRNDRPSVAPAKPIIPHSILPRRRSTLHLLRIRPTSPFTPCSVLETVLRCGDNLRAHRFTPDPRLRGNDCSAVQQGSAETLCVTRERGETFAAGRNSWGAAWSSRTPRLPDGSVAEGWTRCSRGAGPRERTRRDLQAGAARVRLPGQSGAHLRFARTPVSG